MKIRTSIKMLAAIGMSIMIDMLSGACAIGKDNAVAVSGAGVNCNDSAQQWIPGWLTDYSDYEYTVRLWADLHDGLGFHELTHAEIEAAGETWHQSVKILRYDNPPSLPSGTTLYGIHHIELGFVLWMQRFGVTCNSLGVLAQVAETAKNTYDDTKTPAENDAAGNIDYFLVDGKIAPRVMFADKARIGDTWTDWWGPFDPDDDGLTIRPRLMRVEGVRVSFGDKTFENQVKVSDWGPLESGEGTPLESFTYIDSLGGYQREFEQFDSSGNVVFRHIATLGPKTN
jgi:hypothetical protein